MTGGLRRGDTIYQGWRLPERAAVKHPQEIWGELPPGVRESALKMVAGAVPGAATAGLYVSRAPTNAANSEALSPAPGPLDEAGALSGAPASRPLVRGRLTLRDIALV